MVQQAHELPPPPCVRLSLGVTGHRATHAAWEANGPRIQQCLSRILDIVDEAVSSSGTPFGQPIGRTRLHTVLADGVDQLSAREALRRGWELVVPLPFGSALNRALNSRPATVSDARALLAGERCLDPQADARAAAIDELAARARVLELAEQDAAMGSAFLASLASPDDRSLVDAFNADVSQRVALASRVLVEQADIIIAVWDGARTSFAGGTGHTVAAALEHGTSVIWIDALEPEAWRILVSPESLASARNLPQDPDREERLRQMVTTALVPTGPVATGSTPDRLRVGAAALDGSHWRQTSRSLWHIYRFIEAAFGGDGPGRIFRSLRVTFEPPAAIGTGSGAHLLSAMGSLPGMGSDFARAIEVHVLRRFALADGIASHLSDRYRGGMSISFILSALAIVGGIAYLPFFDYHLKWPFALLEFVLLTGIVAITVVGQRRNWHGRWFETRRAAEYLRHAPLLLAVGAMRAPGRWPRGTGSSWPELYARHAMREVGLPAVQVTADYLKMALQTLLDLHVCPQRDYHHAKARRLARVHHNLDKISEWLFLLAIFSVSAYLLLEISIFLGVDVKALHKNFSKIATFLGVMLPTFGAAVAGIRYFADFERFAAISEITATRLSSIHDRIVILLAAPNEAIDYGAVCELVHDCDEVVVSEIENWQSVFGGKHMTIPV